MKKIYLLITLFAFANTVKSQTLNPGHFPSPGDVHQYFNTDTLGIVAGPAGTAQVRPRRSARSGRTSRHAALPRRRRPCDRP